MNEIKLDPKKLLGFKIATDSESATTLRSPEIGANTDIMRRGLPLAGSKHGDASS